MYCTVRSRYGAASRSGCWWRRPRLATLKTNIALPLAVSSTQRWGLHVIASDSNMSRPIAQCPVASCRVWRGNVARSNKQRWYSLESNRHLLVDQLDATLAALPHNDTICPNCYKRIRRLPPSARNLLDELTAAADE